ncbi:hypothetical protein [Paraliomyxa miuraensis]|uniref:hypothetical protein n=1 Tax=Paraliomyxa miuraensis TaxID=376150 RepID=UPI0022586AAD|nr:hypothetical protein [Paraliomyxa miuraensis]MCX4247166.1 hypothetical protein [Paraliomyxa miuraensis]
MVASACDKPGEPTRRPSGAVTFGEQATKVGDVFTGDFTAKIDVEHTADGAPSETVHENLLFHSVYELTVLEVDQGLPETVQVHYTGGREYVLSMGDLEDDDHDHLGDTLEASEGSYRRKGGGGLSDHHDELVLDRDVGRIGTPGTIQAQLRGKSLTAGDTLQLTPGEIRDRFNGEDGTMLTLQLTGLTQRCKREAAVFRAEVEVAAEIENAVVYMKLSGSIEVDVATAMPLTMSLEGPAETAFEFDMARNGGGTASLSGSFGPKGACR